MLAGESSAVFLQDFGLTVWSRAGGDEGMGREPSVSPGSVPTQLFGACWAQPEHCSLTLVPWEFADSRDLEKLVSFENKSPSLLQIISVYF